MGSLPWAHDPGDTQISSPPHIYMAASETLSHGCISLPGIPGLTDDHCLHTLALLAPACVCVCVLFWTAAYSFWYTWVHQPGLVTQEVVHKQIFVFMVPYGKSEHVDSLRQLFIIATGPRTDGSLS